MIMINPDIISDTLIVGSDHVLETRLGGGGAIVGASSQDRDLSKLYWKDSNGFQRSDWFCKEHYKTIRDLLIENR